MNKSWLLHLFHFWPSDMSITDISSFQKKGSKILLSRHWPKTIFSTSSGTGDSYQQRAVGIHSWFSTTYHWVQTPRAMANHRFRLGRKPFLDSQASDLDVIWFPATRTHVQAVQPEFTHWFNCIKPFENWQKNLLRPFPGQSAVVCVSHSVPKSFDVFRLVFAVFWCLVSVSWEGFFGRSAVVCVCVCVTLCSKEFYFKFSWPFRCCRNKQGVGVWFRSLQPTKTLLKS